MNLILLSLWVILLQTIVCAWKDFNIEVLVVVDESLNLKLDNENIDTVEYVTTVFSIANLHYSNLRPNIRIRISDIWIENVNYGRLPFMVNVLGTGRTETRFTLISMESWYRKNILDENVDIVFALTSLDLCIYPSPKNGFYTMETFYETFHDKCDSTPPFPISSNMGMAFNLGSACTTEKMAIVERPDGDIIITAENVAHEIAHLLNLTHDGNIDEDELWCNKSDGHVMTPKVDLRNLKDFAERIAYGNVWSQCSKAHFEKYLPNFKCLENIPAMEKYLLWEDIRALHIVMTHFGLLGTLDYWIYSFVYIVGNNFTNLIFCMMMFHRAMLDLLIYYYTRHYVAENKGIAPPGEITKTYICERKYKEIAPLDGNTKSYSRITERCGKDAHVSILIDV